MLRWATSDEKAGLPAAISPFNPAIAVQYSGQGWRAIDAPAFSRNDRSKALKTHIKYSSSKGASAPIILPLVNVTKT
jgi:hypothetical protein